MRSITTLALATLALSACETTSPTAASAPSAEAKWEQHDQRSPIAGTLINECNGEEVVLSGYAHFRIDLGTRPGGTAYATQHVNTQSIQGVGTTTGARYQYIVVANFASEQQVEEPYAGSSTVRQTVRVIASGKTPNFLAHVILTTSYDGTGSTTDIKQESAECR